MTHFRQLIVYNSNTHREMIVTAVADQEGICRKLCHIRNLRTDEKLNLLDKYTLRQINALYDTALDFGRIVT
jgi:hypothetical protein